MTTLFIEDGYSKKKDIEAVEGIHPACTVVFRPALAKKRTELGTVAGTGNADRVYDFENELIATHVEALEGSKITKKEAAKLIPTLRNKILGLILGYDPAEENADAKN